MMAIVAQLHRGHLNGNVHDEFNMEECYAQGYCGRHPGTKPYSHSITVDMQEVIGIMQVLAGRAHPIHEVYRGDTTCNPGKSLTRARGPNRPSLH